MGRLHFHATHEHSYVPECNYFYSSHIPVVSYFKDSGYLRGIRKKKPRKIRGLMLQIYNDQVPTPVLDFVQPEFAKAQLTSVCDTVGVKVTVQEATSAVPTRVNTAPV